MKDGANVPKLRFPEFLDSGDWEKKKIGDLLVETSRPLEMEDEQEYSLVTVKRRYGGVVSREILKGQAIKVKAQFFVYENDFLISNRQIVHNACGLVPKNLNGSIVSNEYSVLTPRINCDVVFFNYFSQQQKVSESFLLSSVGIVIEKMRFNLNFWLEKRFLFPSLLEQQKIADCLTSIDDRITAETQKLATLKVHKKGLMQQLFPAEGETLPNLRFPEFRDSGEWEEKSLGDIASIKAGTTPPRSNPEFYVDGNIPWVKTTDLNNSYIYITEEKVTSLAKVKLNPEGSILVAMYGGFNQIGRTGYLKIAAATNQAISVLKVKKDKLTSLYLLIWLNSKIDVWRKFAISSRKDANITGADVRNFPIAFPSLQEQQKIAGCLSSLDQLITAQTQKIATLKTHKKGLMQQLFPSVEEVEK